MTSDGERDSGQIWSVRTAMIGSESERESWGVRETGKGGRGERIKKFIRGERGE